MTAPPRTKREHLRRLVEGKNEWSRPLTEEERALGFLGWHERGYLPHCDFPDLVQFVTFRLEDSMPATRCGEWEHLLKIVDVRERRLKLEEYLDRGIGKCALRNAQNAKLVQNALLHFHDDRCELRAWCVMPNHVHALLNVKHTPLWKLLGSWKHFTQTRANRLPVERRPPARLDGVPNFNVPDQKPALPLKWQREYWDTFMRDAAQERRAVHYIENNPVKTKLCRTPEEWPFSSARLRDEYRRLMIPPKENK